MARYEQESRFTRCVRVSMQTVAVAVPLLLVVHGPVHAATPQAACVPTAVSTLDRRLVTKADTDAGEVRRFVERTQAIFQLDMTTAMRRVDRQRDADAACARSVAAR